MVHHNFYGNNTQSNGKQLGVTVVQLQLGRNGRNDIIDGKREINMVVRLESLNPH